MGIIAARILLFPQGARQGILIPDWLFNFFTMYRAARIANRLSKFINTNETILDCGCGSMKIAGILHQQRGIHAFGTDVIDLNQPRHRFCLCSGEQLAFKDNSFDNVLLIFTLHHMENPLDAIKESLRVAKKRLIVLEDVYRNPFELRLLKTLDWYGNILISKDMNFSFQFKTENEWKTIFAGLHTNLTASESIRPNPFRPSRHRMFVLEKNQAQASRI